MNLLIHFRASGMGASSNLAILCGSIVLLTAFHLGSMKGVMEMIHKMNTHIGGVRRRRFVGLLGEICTALFKTIWTTGTASLATLVTTSIH